ncbi:MULTISPECIES: hypothetical protein [Nostoc]|uniref:Uncharacterized protein n=1 Tax=Nostoc paludosum FACHB-159 TaxID=2692908 RepID=A0ABR8KAN3_9NOSO|nr:MULTISPECIES: hypothetical protein [Nostoc]MBD2680809.1 hypothetical protein [Nostoc sp. FACHB-857]MBD2736564.1 hypothetical protein [Nostoc paludosum FACHB-159]
MLRRTLLGVSILTLSATLIGSTFINYHDKAQAQLEPEKRTFSDWGSVKLISAGWIEDTMAVYHSDPNVNPDGCPTTDGGYATNPKDPGHSLFHTTILNAFINQKEVQLLISGCVYGKPRIIGVNIR